MPGYRVFLSHRKHDRLFAEESLKPRIEAAGASVFLDADEIAYGENFRASILNELKLCDEMLVLLTSSAVTRPWVMAEIGAMMLQDKTVNAVQYGPTAMQLQELGILSMLGTINLVAATKDEMEQLRTRVEEADNA